MKSIIAMMTIALALLAVSPVMAGSNDTDNATQSKKVFDRLGGTSGG